jgi:hypothetical protein
MVLGVDSNGNNMAGIVKAPSGDLDVMNRRLSVCYAALTAFLLPITFISDGLTSVPLFGLGLAVAGAPVWLGGIRGYTGATFICLGLLTSLVSGGILSYLESNNYDFNHQRAFSLNLFVATGVVSLAFLLWARKIIGLSSLAVVYGLGTLLNALMTVNFSSPAWWKSELSWAFALVLLGITAKVRSKVINVLALLLIAGISSITGYRSLAGICIVAACLYVYINNRPASTRWTAILKTAALGILGPYLIVQFFTWLLLDGVLGVAAQERTYKQIETSGSLIAGGRQEWAASILLFLDRPMGFGPGAVPHSEDVSLGKMGLVHIGANPNSQYINQYMFGGHLKLHSLAADFWANFGIVGLLVIIMIGLYLVRSLINAMSFGRIFAVQSLLFLWTLWDLMFSPIDSNYMLMIFAVSLLLSAQEPRSLVEYRGRFDSYPYLSRSVDNPS